MQLEVFTLYQLLTVLTRQHRVLAPIETLVGIFTIKIQVFVEFCEFISPLAAIILMFAVYFLLVQHPLELLVRKSLELFIAQRARFVVVFDGLNARFAESVATTVYKKRFAKHAETDGALRLYLRGERFNELAFIATLEPGRRGVSKGMGCKEVHIII